MKKILLIDDNVHLREEIIDALNFEGFEVFSADGGPHGIEMARRLAPDLILCDIRMPEMDGFAVCEKLKSDPITALIPFVFLTAMAETDDARRGMDLGADDYVIKPISLEELLKTIYVKIRKSK